MEVKECIFQVLRTIVSLILWVIFSPVVLFIIFIVTLMYAWRRCIDFIVTFVHPDFIPVAPIDTIYIPLLDSQPGHSFGSISVINIFDDPRAGASIVEAMRDNFRSKILGHPSPSPQFWKLISVPIKYMGYYYWIHFDIDVSEHIRIHPRSEKLNTLESIDEYLTNEWVSSSYNGRPPWEIISIEFDTGSVVCIRQSHLIGGGYAIWSIMEILSGREVPNLKPSLLPLSIFTLVRDLLILPWTIPSIAAKHVTRDDLALEMSCSEQVKTRSRFSLSRIKRISRYFKVHFRTVLASSLGAAVQKFEAKRSSSVNMSKLFINMPWLYSDVTSEPLNNKATAVVVDLSLRPSNTVDRLKYTHKCIMEALSNGEEKFNYYFRFIFYIVPTFKLERMVKTAQLIPTTNSDYPWTTKESIDFFKYTTRDVHAFAGLHGQRFGCLAYFITKGSVIELALVGDKQRIPNKECLDEMCLYIDQELQALDECINSQSMKDIV